MLTSIRRFFSAPVFEDDKEKTRSAKLLHQIITVIWILPILLIVIMVLGGRTEVIPPAIVISITLLTLLILNQAGRVSLASTIITGMILLVFVYADSQNAGNIQPSTLITAIAIIMSGLLLGRRAPLVTAILIAVTHGVIVYLQMQGVIELNSAPALGLENIIITGIMLLMIGFLFQFVISRLQFALDEARKNESELQVSNRELGESRIFLEQRVQERTEELTKIQEQSQATVKDLAEALQIAKLGNWEYDFLKDEFTFNDDFYAMMRTTVEREGGYKMNAAHYTERFVYPEDALMVGMEIGKSIETTDPNFSTQLDHRVIFGDGEVGYVTVRFRIEKDTQGRTVRSYGANQDITERKQAEEALRISQEQYALVLEGSNDGLWDWNIRANQIYYSPRWKGIVGYEEHELENAFSTFENLLHPEDRDRVLQAVDAYLEKSSPKYDVEFRFRHKDGSYRWIRDRGKALRDENGQPYRMSGAHSDITPLKETEVILAKRATELETVAQVVTSIATIQDPQEMLQYVSDLTKMRFNFYHAHVYLLHEEDGMLELAAGAGEAGQKMVANKHAIPLNREQSLVARAARSRQGVVVNDITLAQDFLPNPLLPATRAELAVPLIIRDRVLGVLDVQSAQVDAFNEEDVRIQTILAAQIAVALENARANEQTVKTLQELNAINRRLMREGWRTYLAEKGSSQLGYIFEENELVPLSENGVRSQETEKTFVQPIVLRGERIGQLVTTDTEMGDEDLRNILSAVSQGLSAHLENLRLTEEAERRVNELGVVNEIGQVLTTEVDLQQILIAVTSKLSQGFGANIAYVAIYDSARQMIDVPYMLDHGQEILNEPSFSYGDGVNSTIIKTRQSVFVNQDTERRLTMLGAIPTGTTNTISKSFIGVPMIVGDRVIGVLNIQDADQEGRFSEGDVKLLETIAANLAVAIQNARLFKDTQKRAEREAKVNLIGQKIQSATTVQGAMQTAVQELGLALKARRTVVELATKSTDNAVSTSSTGD